MVACWRRAVLGFFVWVEVLGSGLPVLIVQYNVALDASTSRPSISSVPWVSRSSVACSPSSVSGAALSGSSMTDAVTVLPRADVPIGVQRQAAQRAGRTAGGNDLGGPLGEGARGPWRDAHPQHPRPVGGNIVGQRLDRLVRFFLRLDNDHAPVTVPGQGDGTDPEVLQQRQVERRVILQPGGSGGRHARRSAGTSEHLVQEFV